MALDGLSGAALLDELTEDGMLVVVVLTMLVVALKVVSVSAG